MIKSNKKILKYVVIGGWITSKNDGDRHYINARKLCGLYGVDPMECMLYEEREHQRIKVGFLGESLLVLRPRYDGNYILN